jgi:hypothetical protein
MEVQDCLTSIFNLLRIDPFVSLLLQYEIDQILLQVEAPHRWKNNAISAPATHPGTRRQYPPVVDPGTMARTIL